MNIIKNNPIKILVVLVLLLLMFYLAPVYGFFAHMGRVPMSPFGWLVLAEKAPVTQELKDDHYREAADTSLEFMEQKRKELGAASYSAAVAVGGKVVWAGAVGWADVEAEVNATPSTIYRIGSTSKAITATALARLVEKGVVDLDTAIVEYMPDLPNKSWENITLRMLASHSSGLVHYNQKGEVKDYIGLYQSIAQNKHYYRMKDALDIFDGTELISKPGDSFYYSSQGTLLLGAVLSAATGKPFMDIVKDEVLKPLAMESTIVSPVGKSAGVANFATPYFNRQSDGQQQLRPWRDVDLSQRLPGGGFASTSSNLVKLGVAYFDQDYISDETRAEFWAPQKLNDGEINSDGYAIGWRYREFNFEGVGLVKNANHGGVSKGSQSWLMVFPEYEMSIAINANVRTKNFSDFGLLMRDIAIAFIKAKENT